MTRCPCGAARLPGLTVCAECRPLTTTERGDKWARLRAARKLARKQARRGLHALVVPTNPGHPWSPRYRPAAPPGDVAVSPYGVQEWS